MKNATKTTATTVSPAAIKAAIEALFDAGGWEMDVSADVKREFDKRLPVITAITTRLHDRVKQLEADVAALKAAAGIATPAPTGRIDAVAAASAKPAAATGTKITVKLGRKAA